MSDWTPWQTVALVGVLALAAFGFTALAAWYSLTRSHRESAGLTAEERAARHLGEAISRCGDDLDVEAVDAVLAVFARSSAGQKGEMVAAIRGLLAAAPDGPQNLPDLGARVLAVARRLGTAEPVAGPTPGPG
jgi:DNA-binding IclR family transcriptional regulator